MKSRLLLMACWLIFCSCTAIVDQRRPPAGTGQIRQVQAFKLSQISLNDAGPSMCSSLRGDIFLTDIGGWRIMSYNTEGAVNYESSLSSARCFLLNGQTNGLYLADDLNKNIRYYDAWGQKQNAIPYSGSSFVSGAALKDGTLYLLDNLANTVVVMDNQGKEIRRFRLMAGNTGLQRPNALAVDGTGSVIAAADAQAQKVTIFNSFGSYLGRVEALPSTSPSAICFEQGTTNLWVCEKENNRLLSYEIKPSGHHLKKSCSIPSPLSVTGSAFGRIFVASDQYLWNVTEE